jgi:hypothetical protein
LTFAAARCVTSHAGHDGIAVGLRRSGICIGSMTVSARIECPLHVQNPVLPSQIPPRLAGVAVGAVDPVVSEFRDLDFDLDQAQAAIGRDFMPFASGPNPPSCACQRRVAVSPSRAAQ